MAVHVTPQSEIDKYFESENLSQSRLKQLMQGLDSFLDKQEKSEEELYYTEKGNLIIGSAVDCILTGEEGRFDDTYFVSDMDKKPSDAEMSMINMIFDLAVNEQQDNIKELDQYPGFIESAVEFHGWQPKWKMETKIAKIIEAGNVYFENLKMSFGKQVIDKNQHLTIDVIVKSLRENPRTKHFFDREENAKIEDMDFYYQLPIYFEFRGISCKALLDILIAFKNKDGVIYKVLPVDLKTMSGYTINFLNSLKSFRYDIQAAWYTEALLNPNSTFRNITGDAEFSVENFNFVVESTTKPGKPLVYVLNDELLHIGTYGRPAVNTVNLGMIFNDNEPYQPIPMVKEIKGFYSLIEDYLYYQKTGWKEEKVVTDNNGVLQIGWDGIM